MNFTSIDKAMSLKLLSSLKIRFNEGFWGNQHNEKLIEGEYIIYEHKDIIFTNYGKLWNYYFHMSEKKCKYTDFDILIPRTFDINLLNHYIDKLDIMDSSYYIYLLEFYVMTIKSQTINVSQFLKHNEEALEFEKNKKELEDRFKDLEAREEAFAEQQVKTAERLTLREIDIEETEKKHSEFRKELFIMTNKLVKMGTDDTPKKEYKPDVPKDKSFDTYSNKFIKLKKIYKTVEDIYNE